jgi:hypothetical protein
MTRVNLTGNMIVVRNEALLEAEVDGELRP